MEQVTLKDAVLAAALGATIAVFAYAPPSPELVREHATLLLIITSFVIPRIGVALTVATFLGIAALFSGGSIGFDPLRIALFTLVLAVLRGEPISAFPLLVISPLWMIVLFGNLLPLSYLRGLFPAPSVPLSYRAGLEIGAVVAGGLLAGFRPSLKIFRSRPAPLPLRTLLSYLLLLLPLLLIIGALTLAYLRTGATPRFLLGLLGPDLRMATLGALILSFLINATAILIARDLAKSLASRALAASPRSNRLSASMSVPVAKGFFAGSIATHEPLVRPLESGLVREDTKPLEDRIKQLSLELGDEHALRLQRDAEREKVLDLLDSAAWGTMIVRADETISHISSSICDLFELPYRSAPPTSLDVLRRHKTRWGEEILELLIWAKGEYEQLAAKGPRIYRSPHFEEASLTLAVGAFVRDSMSSSGVRTRHDTRSHTRDVTLILLTHKERDLRPVQLRFLTPSIAETGGSFAEESVIGIADDLHQLAAACKELDDPLRVLRLADKGFLKESPLGQRLIRVLEAVEKMSIAASERAQQLTAFAEPKREHIEDIRLAPLLSSGFSYLYALLGLENPPFAKLTDQEGQLAVRYPPEEMFAFIHYYISLIRYLLPRNRLHGSLDLEEINAQAGALLGGIAEGTYVRILLSHEGQSIPGNVLAAQENPLRNSDQRGTIETSLFLLSRQISRLSGLLSITSTEAKGTEITIYLPLELQKRRRHQPARLERSESGLFPAIDSTRGPTLVLARDPATAHRLGSALERNGLPCTVKLFDELLFDLDESLGFSGLGFGGGESDGGVSESDLGPPPKRSSDLDLSSFGAVIAELNGAPQSVKELVLTETASHPSLRKFALSASKAQSDEFIAIGWSWIATPVSEETLTAAVMSETTGSNA